MSEISAGLQALGTPTLIMFLVGGVILGFVVGILPGLSTSNTAAILLPFVLMVPVETGLVLIVAIYAGAQYGGAVPAILLNVPGEAGSAATALDGYPMTRQGRGAEAIGIARMASVLGLLGVGAAILLIGPLGRIALNFGPAETFLVAVIGILIVSGVVAEDPAKGVAAGLTGVLLASMGANPFTGEPRLTFGFVELYDGVPLIPAIIGLFALSEMALTARALVDGRHTLVSAATDQPKQSVRDGLVVTLRHPRAVVRSSVVGFILGVIPGVGNAVTNFVAYAAAKRASKTPEMFGKGAPEGVIASEASDNAGTGGGMIPTLALGIPGSATGAVMLAALFLQGVQPGPRFMDQQGEVAYTILFALLIANILILPLGVALARPIVAITRVPLTLLVPGVTVICIVGVYASQNSIFDVYLAVIFGALGYLMRRGGFPIVPVILGIVLGPLLENNLIRSLQLGRGELSYFADGMIAKLLLLVIALMVASTIWRMVRRPRRRTESTTDAASLDRVAS